MYPRRRRRSHDLARVVEEPGGTPRRLLSPRLIRSALRPLAVAFFRQWCVFGVNQAWETPGSDLFLLSSSVAGATKKSFSNSAIFIGYNVGNIVAPYTIFTCVVAPHSPRVHRRTY